MRYARLTFTVLAAAVLLLGIRPSASAPQAPPSAPTIQQFLSPASPQEIVSARKADAVAWASYEEGKRNVYVAAAPAFVPVRLTNTTKDDGVMVSKVQISDDGNTVTFMRGADDVDNRQGWSADPTANPDGTDRSIWAARVSNPGVSWKGVSIEGKAHELAPDGSSVIFAKDGQIYRAKVTTVKPEAEMDRGEKPFIREWGTNSNPRFSPDGKKIAFVTNRTDHGFIAVYDMATRTVSYLAPSVDRDTNPNWSADSKQIIFTRQPGLPFGQQAQPSAGGIGLPAGPAAAAAAGAAGRGGRNGGGGGRNGGGAPAVPPAAAPATASATPPTTPPDPLTAPVPGPAGQRGGRGGQGGRGQGGGQGAGAQAGAPGAAVVNNSPGLMRATFKGGYTNSLWIADVATGEAHEFWNNAADRQSVNLGNYRWVGDSLIYKGGGARGGGGGGGNFGGGAGAGGGRLTAPVPFKSDTPAELKPTPAASGAPGTPTDQWDRFYAVSVKTPNSMPVLLTPTDGLIEDATSVAYSADGKTLFYCTNAKDIERRHIWAVPTSGGDPKQVTIGEGIETSPQPLASGKALATISASWNMTQSVGIWNLADNKQKIVFPTSRPGFPVDAHVKPEIVMTQAADGLQIHNQLFLPKNIKPGEKRPAMIFVHGGPQREMLLGYHYMQTYHWFYGVNEWLASQGYVVMSINYRSGIGYGNSFRNMPNTESRGNSEYQDVYAGAKYLQSRPDVDPNRVGIWGLSYGGLLTSQALARSSDVFKVGADFAGVHLYGSSLDPGDLSYQSSAISQIDNWKSPVFLVQGDDDRNVSFTQMTGLVQLLRQRDIQYELIVFPDDVHESLLHHRWIYALNHMSDFLHKYLGDAVTGASK